MRRIVLLFVSVFIGQAHALDVNVVGLFPGKAVLVLDGRPPKTYSTGAQLGDGARLISVSESSATVEVQGKRQTLQLGEHIGTSAGSGPTSVTLQADERGHFSAQAQINGATIVMLVDTGATAIALPASEAARLRIDYKKGQQIMINTANGVTRGYRVALDTIKVGMIEMHQVDAVIQEQGLSVNLLGMSFLNRTEMRREGSQMTLTKRF